MKFYGFIKTKGEKNIGFFVPRMYKLGFSFRELKTFGFRFLKDRLSGWTIWWVENFEDYYNATCTLEKLQETHLFTFKVGEWS